MMTMTEVFNNIKVNNTCKNIPVANIYDWSKTLLVEMDIKFVSPEDNIFISKMNVNGKMFYQDWIWNKLDNRFEPLSDADDSSNKPKDIWKFNNFSVECPKYLSLNKLYNESIMDSFLLKYDCPEYTIEKGE